MAAKIVVFVDAQNLYEGARQAFFLSGGSHTLGQFDPQKLGLALTAAKPFGQEKSERSLAQVRIYCGLASSSKDPKSNSARRRQIAVWSKNGVEVTTRSLRYPSDWPKTAAEEKGIDVALAIDFVTMAVDGDYDIGIIASTDTDLRPAVEYVIKRQVAAVEVAAWHSEKSRRPLSVEGSSLWCHRLTKAHYDGVADYRDYNIVI